MNSGRPRGPTGVTERHAHPASELNQRRPLVLDTNSPCAPASCSASGSAIGSDPTAENERPAFVVRSNVSSHVPVMQARDCASSHQSEPDTALTAVGSRPAGGPAARAVAGASPQMASAAASAVLAKRNTLVARTGIERGVELRAEAAPAPDPADRDTIGVIAEAQIGRIEAIRQARRR